MTRIERKLTNKKIKTLTWLFWGIMWLAIFSIIIMFNIPVLNKNIESIFIFLIYEFFCALSLIIIGEIKTKYLNKINDYKHKIELKKIDIYFSIFIKTIKYQKYNEAINFFFDYIQPKEWKYPTMYYCALGYLSAKIEDTDYSEAFWPRYKNVTNFIKQIISNKEYNFSNHINLSLRDMVETNYAVSSAPSIEELKTKYSKIIKEN